MSQAGLRMLVVVPFLDEEEHLPVLLESLAGPGACARRPAAGRRRLARPLG